MTVLGLAMYKMYKKTFVDRALTLGPAAGAYEEMEEYSTSFSIAVR